MLPDSAESPENSQIDKMLAIIEYWEGDGYHTDNTEKYLFLLLFKLGLDAVVFYLCSRKPYTSFFSMCSLSIVLADTVLVFLMANVWLLGAERSLLSPCFILANSSATYGALVLPMMSLALLDFSLVDTYFGKQSTSCKFVRNVVFTLLVWVLAVIHSFGSTKTELMELNYTEGIKALVCEVHESTLITYLTLGLFMGVMCVMLPFWSSIHKWVREADRLSEQREEEEDQKSDLLFTSTNGTETKTVEDSYREEILWTPPPLWLSLMLGFAIFWMPYLVMSVVCMVFGFAVPAYVTVNLLWLECTNSLLLGMMFWAKRKTLGPYNRLPDNVCLWPVYWHLSQGPQGLKPPVAVFNPSNTKRNTLFDV